MAVLRDVRERESSIDADIVPMLDMYDMLDIYVPGGLIDKEEMDQKAVIRAQWTRLSDFAEEVADRLSDVQGVFKRRLLGDVRTFSDDVVRMRAAFEREGPLAPGLAPDEAVARLARFADEVAALDRRLDVLQSGETLFGLRLTEYPELVKTKREAALLDSLYSLYTEVEAVVDEYRALTWPAFTDSVASMLDAVAGFDARCKRLPKKLRDWGAYESLRSTVTNLQELLPLLAALSKPSVKPRHWQAIVALTGRAFAVDSDAFRLEVLLDADLVSHRETVEEVCDAADKQAAIEAKLDEITHTWSSAEFEFTRWRGRDVRVLRGHGGVSDALEESLMALQTMLAMRHVAPFKVIAGGATLRARVVSRVCPELFASSIAPLSVPVSIHIVVLMSPTFRDGIWYMSSFPCA